MGSGSVAVGASGYSSAETCSGRSPAGYEEVVGVRSSSSLSDGTLLTGENRLSLNRPNSLNQDLKQPVPSEQHFVGCYLAAHAPCGRQRAVRQWCQSSSLPIGSWLYQLWHIVGIISSRNKGSSCVEVHLDTIGSRRWQSCVSYSSFRPGVPEVAGLSPAFEVCVCVGGLKGLESLSTPPEKGSGGMICLSDLQESALLLTLQGPVKRR